MYIHFNSVLITKCTVMQINCQQDVPPKECEEADALDNVHIYRWEMLFLLATSARRWINVGLTLVQRRTGLIRWKLGGDQRKTLDSYWLNFKIFLAQFWFKVNLTSFISLSLAFLFLSQQKRDVDHMLVLCWVNVEDSGPTLNKHMSNVSSLSWDLCYHDVPILEFLNI